MSVDGFNDYFKDNSLGIQLKVNYQEYEMRPSKKNGHPKIDLPCIHDNVLVKDTLIENFALQYRKENILTKLNRQGKCNKCLVM